VKTQKKLIYIVWS